MPVPLPNPGVLFPLIVQILRNGQPVLKVGRLALDPQTMEAQPDLAEELAHELKRDFKREKGGDETQVLTLGMAIRCVEEAVNGGTVADAMVGSIKAILVGGSKDQVNVGFAIGDSIVRRLRENTLRQDKPRLLRTKKGWFRKF